MRDSGGSGPGVEAGSGPGGGKVIGRKADATPGVRGAGGAEGGAEGAERGGEGAERDAARPARRGGSSGGRPADRRLRPRRPLLLLAAGAACFLLSRLASHAPGLVEAVYGTRLGVWIPLALSRITGWIPFPLGELLMAALLAAWLWWAVRGAVDVVRGRRRLRNALGGAGLRLAADVGLIVVLFYVLWGFDYARAPLAGRLGLPAGTGADTAEIARLAREELLATNAAYRRIHGSEDAGHPTRLAGGPGKLREGLEAGWRSAVRLLGLPGSLLPARGPVKSFVPDRLLSGFGISGFFFPWTGEAIVDAGEPALLLPFDMAHEKAHQRGFAPENEASFMGWLAATRSPDPRVAYAGHAVAQLHLVSVLARSDPERAKALAGERLPGVRRDIRDYADYLRRTQIRLATEATTRVNDAYLKANQVPGGVQSYGRVVRLLVSWARAHGGRLEGGGGLREPATAPGPGGAGRPR